MTTLGLSYAVHVVAEAADVWREEPEADAAGGRGAGALGGGAAAHAHGPHHGAGFATLCLSPLPAVREFGILSVVGVLFTVIASLTLAPALLAVLPRPRRLPARRGTEPGPIAARVGAFDVSYRRPIFIGAAVLAVLALAGAARIQVGSQQITKFDADAPVRVHFERINETLGGANPMFVVLESAKPQGFHEPELLAEVAALQAWLREQPEVGAATSLVDTVKLLHRAFREGEPEAFAIPDSKRFISQLLFFAEGPELRRDVDRAYRTAMIRLRHPGDRLHRRRPARRPHRGAPGGPARGRDRARHRRARSCWRGGSTRSSADRPRAW